ncbi:acyl-CoA N-acyltransferase [Leucogyrophana mollusca]|uniref:Acyl-CoA N-acyltransferase n=1 Tax=Leucogyrophana mollusca TaxID=85980 RepID=A0ACB8B6A7_9AGAM|nr:acyl-CoA N-acyltransferase [Leucogyrophana mollusca]
MSLNSFSFRPPVTEDLPALADIFNHEITTSTRTFRAHPVDLANRQAWLEDIQKEQYPCLVIVHSREGGTNGESQLFNIVGWCNLSRYRTQEAYNATAEISLYIHQNFRGLGLGSQIFELILAEARIRGYRTILAMVAMENTLNARFWEKHGFQQRGILRDVGMKFDRWLDIGVYQLMV